MTALLLKAMEQEKGEHEGEIRKKEEGVRTGGKGEKWNK